MMLVRKNDNESPLSNFAHNAKAAEKKSIYTRALDAAKKEQLLMIKEGQAILESA
jgi:hypothetical protein